LGAVSSIERAVPSTARYLLAAAFGITGEVAKLSSSFLLTRYLPLC
jgi:hypothetical protein